MNTEQWHDFSKEERLQLTVNVGEEEKYLVRYPCLDPIWFKIHLNGKNEQNSHIEMESIKRGNIYCAKAGSRSWYDGEKTDFYIFPSDYKKMGCEKDGKFIIFE